LNIAVALLMGQKQDISSEVIDYQYAGAIHILSVSGLHVGYLLLFSKLHAKTNSNTKKGKLKLLILLTLASFAIAGLSPSVCALLCFLLLL
jgi:competence protein ComEC